MLNNYLTIAIRNLWRNKTYSFINIVGLTVGMAVFILIWLYVAHELSYDRYHTKADRTYRLIIEQHTDLSSGGGVDHEVPDVIATAMREMLPEVETVVHIREYPENLNILVGGVHVSENGLMEADDTFFEIFDFEAVAGNLRTALQESGSAVITETAAKRYFGNENPIGQIIEYEPMMTDRLSSRSGVRQFTITAIVNTPPSNSILQFNILARYEPSIEPGWDGWRSSHSYIVLREETDLEIFNTKLPQFVTDQAVNIDYGFENGNQVEVSRADAPVGMYSLYLQPLTDIYSHPYYLLSSAPDQGPLFYISVMSVIAVLILMIACVNYMNLVTSRAVKRLREMGVRSTIGASNSQIAGQVVGESILTSLMAVLLALVLVELVQPAFNAIVNRHLALNLMGKPIRLPMILALATGVGLISGAYPAYVFSSRKAMNLFQGGQPGQVGGPRFRKILVVFQFSTLIALTIAMGNVYSQMSYIRNNRLNLADDQVVVLEPYDGQVFYQYEGFKRELLGHPEVSHVTFGPIPGRPLWGISRTAVAIVQDATNGTPYMIGSFVGYDYFETLGLELIAGQTFSDYAESTGDSKQAVIITQKTAQLFGLENPIGKEVTGYRDTHIGTIIGMLDDFHTRSYYHTTDPYLFKVISEPTAAERPNTNILVRIYGDQIPEGMAAIAETWQRFNPSQVLSARLIDEVLDVDYRADLQLGSILGWFTFLGVLIGCLGLYGLAAFSTEHRTKEIGIRKVVGASVAQVVTLLSKEFLVLVLIANVIAWPIAWYAMHRWLENFAYRIELGVGVFILAGLLALVIALATVSWQTVRAATANPVDSLRYE